VVGSKKAMKIFFNMYAWRKKKDKQSAIKLLNYRNNKSEWIHTKNTSQ
jgi:hypothetical protein